jgi:uncharacterized membrane protein
MPNAFDAFVNALRSLGEAFVERLPYLSVGLVVLLVLGLLGRLAQSIIRRLGSRTEGIGEPEPQASLPDGDPTVLWAPQMGYLEHLEDERLLDLAQRHRLVIKILVRPGDFLSPKRKTAEVWGDLNPEIEKELALGFVIGPRRTASQDPEFSFHQLTEVAVRALSPSINDPYTATSCVKRLVASLSILADRHPPESVRRDRARKALLIAPLSPSAT